VDDDFYNLCFISLVLTEPKSLKEQELLLAAFDESSNGGA